MNMNYTVTYLAYFTPIILTALVVILVIALRWFTHKERMGRIAQGMTSEEKGKAEKSPKIALATGLILSLIGLALTIGLVTLGVGPWLLAGLLPLSVGLGFILVSLVLAPAKPKKQKKQEPEEEPVTVEEVTAEPILESFRLDEEDEEDEEIEVI
jgi:hypothetical protein